jgi:hypothetical protein
MVKQIWIFQLKIFWINTSSYNYKKSQFFLLGILVKKPPNMVQFDQSAILDKLIWTQPFDGVFLVGLFYWVFLLIFLDWTTMTII